MKYLLMLCSLLLLVACTEQERQTIKNTDETVPILDKVRELEEDSKKVTPPLDSLRKDSSQMDSLN